MRKVFAYCFAVLVAALCVLAPSQPRLAPTWADVPFLTTEALVAFVVTGLVALPPFLVAVKVATAKRLNSVIYFVVFGIALALAADLAVAGWVAGWAPAGDPERLPFQEGVLRFLPSFLSAGALGGLCYWMLAGRILPETRR